MICCCCCSLSCVLVVVAEASGREKKTIFLLAYALPSNIYTTKRSSISRLLCSCVHFIVIFVVRLHLEYSYSC